jgi:acetyl-CoA carboxylase alpha subunit
VGNKGLRAALDKSLINSAVTQYWRVSVVDVTASTQSDLVKRVQAGKAKPGDVIAANYQSAGRGRMSRTFEAPKNSALLFSFHIKPTRTKNDWGWISLIAGVAVAQVLKDYKATVKWPNDILINDKKVSGLISEIAEDGVVLGIGINVGMTAEELPVLTATSLAIEGVQGIDTLIPDSPNQPYDMKVLIHDLVDEGEFLEVHALYAPNIVVGFARIEGESVGIIANQPNQLAGTLDINSSEKAARFLRFCDAFNIPILTLVDVPGFLPGTEQEWDGIIRRGAKLLYAYAEASVPLVTLITRKAYGGAFIVMGSKYLGSDINFAWPSAEIAVMGAQGAVNILYRKEIADAKDPAAARAELINEYNESLANPYLAAERGTIDTVIEPNQSRAYITKAFRTLRTKRDTLPARKHGNIPL